MQLCATYIKTYVWMMFVWPKIVDTILMLTISSAVCVLCCVHTRYLNTKVSFHQYWTIQFEVILINCNYVPANLESEVAD
jgi:hypothetical protein